MSTENAHQGSATEQDAQGQAQRRLPEFFRKALSEHYSTELIEAISAGVDSRRISSLRVNTLLGNQAEVLGALAAAGIETTPVSWYDQAFSLPQAQPRDFWGLDFYDQGKIYLQSLSSMLPALAIAPKPDEDILDMCAAPGGKTTLMATLRGSGRGITACELHAPRAEKLHHNLTKQGATNVNVMCSDARLLDSWFSFDKVLLDAPCSGSGTIWLGDDKLSKRFNPGLLAKVRKQQTALLAKALEVVKPGGTLLYSTCSVLKQENEEQVNTALKKASRAGSYKIVPVALPGAQIQTINSAHEASAIEDPGIIPALPSSIEGALTVCPTRYYEGFFTCKILRLA